jgi:hypothetical protein
MSYVGYKNEIERIKNSIEIVPFLEHIMQSDNNIVVFGSFVRKLVEVCVVEKRELRPDEIHVWLKTHDIDVAIRLNKSSEELIEYLGKNSLKYSFNGYEYANCVDKVPRSTNWDERKYEVGHHTYYLKNVKYDVIIHQGHYNVNSVDFTCNTFVMRYMKNANDNFIIWCNWNSKYTNFYDNIQCVARRKIILATLNYDNNVKIWYRMSKLINNGYNVDMSRRDEFINFTLNTLVSMFVSLTTSFKCPWYSPFMNIEGARVHSRDLFVDKRIQNIILDVFSSEITLEQLLLKTLSYKNLFNNLDKEFYNRLVSEIVIVQTKPNSTWIIEQMFQHIFVSLKKYDEAIDIFYTKTNNIPMILESIKCLCFVFCYLCNLIEYVEKRLSKEQFIENVNNNVIVETKTKEISVDALDFVLYTTSDVKEKKDNSILKLDKLYEICNLRIVYKDDPFAMYLVQLKNLTFYSVQNMF